MAYQTTVRGKLRWQGYVEGPRGPDGKRKPERPLFPTKKKAVEWEARRRAEIEAQKTQGANPLSDRQLALQQGETRTLRELIQKHRVWFQTLVARGEKSERTAETFDSHEKVHIQADPIWSKSISQIDTFTLKQFLNARIEAGVTPLVAARIRKSFGSWWKYAIEEAGWTKINIARECSVEQESKVQRQLRYLERDPDEDDVKALLKAAEVGPQVVRDRAAIRLLLMCGVRISELLGLYDDHVVMLPDGTGLIKIRWRLNSRKVPMFGPVKTENGLRDIPISVTMANHIKAWRQERGVSPSFEYLGKRYPGLLFPVRHTTHAPIWTYDTFKTLCWKPAMKRAGLARSRKDAKAAGLPECDFYPHTLRHAFAGQLIDGDTEERDLQLAMGHANAQFTKDRYGHKFKKAKRLRGPVERAERAWG